LRASFYETAGINEEEAKGIAKETEKRIKDMNVKFLSGPLVRELSILSCLNMAILNGETYQQEWGTPVFDAYRIDMGSGFEARDNANLQENAETSHKKKGGQDEQGTYLLMIPPKLADSHP